MECYKKAYYEQSVFWDEDYLEKPDEKERIDEVIKTIPPDVRSILDVGCGNGSFVNTVADNLRYKFQRVTGLDSAEEALKYVRTEKLKGSIAKLPFEDASFDLVTSLEVLEHLEQNDSNEGRSELQRVSRKYIIVTVPNKEDLIRHLVICPQCYCCFNPSFHVRCFDKKMLRHLFRNFNLIECREIGPINKRIYYNTWLRAGYLFCLKPFPPHTAICPQCGYQKTSNGESFDGEKKKPLTFFTLLKPIVQLVSRKKRLKPWLLALYEKKNAKYVHP